MRELFEQADKAPSERNPMEAAQANMRAQLPKRFYKEVDVAPGGHGFAVLLDGRPVKTPGRNPLEFDNEALAELVAAEWRAQQDVIDPQTMPVTRLANTAIDGVASDPQAVLEDILKYSASDLMCYRAGSPQELVKKQAEAWDPIIDWLRDELGANFVLAEGVMHVAQPREAIAVFGARLKNHAGAGEGALRLACLHTFTTLTGSAFLALAIAEKQMTAEEAWTAAHVDEDWNIALWGEDREAAARRSQRWAEMKAAGDVLAALA